MNAGGGDYRIMSHFAIIDSRMSALCKQALREHGLTLLEIPENPCYSQPISAHPDLFVFPYPNGILVDHSIASLLEKHLFDGEAFDRSVLFRKESWEERIVHYPDDCRLNFALCGHYLIGNPRAMHRELEQLVQRYGWEIIAVRQGYAKCNICIVSDNALITEDIGIAKACGQKGIDVLFLRTGAVRLAGYPYGFIGGASSSVVTASDEKQIFFCGNIFTHPEYERIRDFCRKYNVQVTSLSNEPLQDFGSVFVL